MALTGSSKTKLYNFKKFFIEESDLKKLLVSSFHAPFLRPVLVTHVHNLYMYHTQAQGLLSSEHGACNLGLR